MEYPPAELPPRAPFNGVGVYTIHYRGDFAPYADMPDEEPIYVGKAELRGRRQGRVIEAHPSPVLHRRLCEHADSIQMAFTVSSMP
ncbi:MAG: Eco29kI family restriction endonuclease [Boseongicola sp. SB0662_bin_57]|nr:Eco29kI family restriction endonuclease [Boseongicola sp. SB0662_bin_57]